MKENNEMRQKVSAYGWVTNVGNVGRGHRRALLWLGMIALDQRDYQQAAAYLEQAYRQAPSNQATIKALGYSYLWTGRLDAAEALFRKVNVQTRLRQELEYQAWWWEIQNQDRLSAYAARMLLRLS